MEMEMTRNGGIIKLKKKELGLHRRDPARSDGPDGDGYDRPVGPPRTRADAD